MSNLIDKIDGLYGIYKLNLFRQTPGVLFDKFPMEMIDSIDAVDRVLHEESAHSPGAVGDVERPWYMHPYQSDHLMVLEGTRFIELYNQVHGKIERFKFTPNAIYKNGELIHDGGAVLTWPNYVFHRIISGREGSASVNFASHCEDFDIDENFNIYDLDTETGEYEVIRKGFKDQFI